MTPELKRISCPPECGYELTSHDEKELVELTMLHAKKFHADKGYSKDDIEGLVQKV